jgi:predicted Zn-dependent protease with MMP-like domain
MNREHFVKVVKDSLDSLPQEFRNRMHNIAVLVQDMPPNQRSHPKRLLLGVFHGVPMTQKSVFDLSTGPDHIVLYQKNIEAVCSNDEEVREQIRLTVIHELGHYFGMSEDQLRGV